MAEPMDIKQFLEQIEGEWDLAEQAYEIFVQEGPRLLALLRESLDAGDAQAAYRSAHTVKGMLGSFWAHPAIELAAQIESLGEQGDLAKAAPLVDALGQEVLRVRESLEELLKTKPTLDPE